jgi:hypothetical protein
MQAKPGNEGVDSPRLARKAGFAGNTLFIKSRGAGVALVFALACGASLQSSVSAAEVPDKLKPGANETLATVAHAKGVQEYEWAFVAPEADLFDAGGVRFGHHFAGPHWEAADGSRILGATKERADAPAAGAIPWLLLAAKSDGPEGEFSRFTSVQRINTVGGVAPKGGCSQSAIGTTVRINYAADYYFFAGE